jgi:hypothetical protein
MSTTKLYHKLAVERCRMSLAQLCAATHLGPVDGDFKPYEVDTIRSLIVGLDRDISIIDELSSFEE